MIRIMLFDLDGTLLDRDASVLQFVAAQHRRLSTHLGHVPHEDYAARWIELDCHGHVWKDKVYQQLAVEFAITGLSWQELLHDYETNFMHHCVPFAGLNAMLANLQQQGCALGIITNGLTAFQSRAVQGLGILEFFQVVLISEAEQVRKPHPEIFHRALHRLNAKVEDAVFIGDHPEADIGGAQAAGLKAIWKRNPHWPEPKSVDATIDDLSKLPDILQRL